MDQIFLRPFQALQDFQAQLYHLSLFLFSPLPLQHPHSLSLVLFIHGLQQFGQVTIQINHKNQKVDKQEKKKKEC